MNHSDDAESSFHVTEHTRLVCLAIFLMKSDEKQTFAVFRTQSVCSDT